MVSILQLVILIIPTVAFRVLILLAWCQKAGPVGWGQWRGQVPSTRPLLQSLPWRPVEGGQASSPFRLRLETRVLWPQGVFVNEHVLVKRILVVK